MCVYIFLMNYTDLNFIEDKGEQAQKLKHRHANSSNINLTPLVNLYQPFQD